MHHVFNAAEYLRWDESIEASMTPDELMDALAEDILKDGDLNLSLQRAFRWGSPEGNNRGLQDLLRRLKEERQKLLERFDFGSTVDQIQEQLRDIIRRERSTVQERRDQLDAADGGELAGFEEFLRQREETLDNLPGRPADQIQELESYEFLNRPAGEDFAELVRSLQQQVADALFGNLMGGNGDGGQTDLSEMKEFLQDLNEAFEQERRGEQPDLDRLNNRWAQQLGGRVNSMQELRDRLRARMQAAQNLVNMLSPDQRSALQDMIQQSLEAAGLMDEFRKLQEAIGPIGQPTMRQQGMPGAEPASMGVAMQVLDQADRMQQLEMELRGIHHLDELEGIDPELLKQVLSEEDQEWLERWTHIEDDLVDAGFVNRTARGLELTPRAVRRIGERALEDIFASLRQQGLGEHDTTKRGVAGELVETSRPWQFGDPFALDLPRTVMNGVLRHGPGAPVRLDPDNFEVQDHESRTSTATVLLIDMSRSMLHNGAWDAAKRSALALDTLIRSKYPRDMLELIGFAATASSLRMVDLPTLEWNEYTYGTNLQHALELAREKLRPERGRNRQVIVITDGEPTAHIERGYPVFEYPTTPETYEATLREVIRCTREDITINTFLLESNPRMRAFIDDLMRINRGKVIAVDPDRLGNYVLRDFLSGRNQSRHN